MGDEKTSVPENLPESKESNIIPTDSGAKITSASAHSDKKDGDAVIDVPKTAEDEDKGGFGAYLVSTVPRLAIYSTAIS